MKLPALAWIALALTAGCMRFGYAPEPRKLDAGFDSGMTPFDAAANGGSGGMDAAMRGDAAGAGASAVPSDAGGAGNAARDAGDMLDAGMRDAGGRDSGTIDSGMIDSGTRDSGTMDSGTTDSGTKDSGTVDSGRIDSGMTDPEADPAWTEDCPGVPSVLFCDDFEGGLAKWSYTVHTRGSTALTTNYKHADSYSLRATTSASTTTVQSKARRGTKAFGHRKSGELWARYYYFLPSSVTLTDKISIGVISELEDPFLGFSVLIHPGGVGIESGAISRTINTAFPRDQWVCIEMRVQIHASTGRFDFYMNGTPTLAITGVDTLPDQGYTSFEVGVHYANFGQGAITAYTDDVKLGTGRLGCN